MPITGQPYFTARSMTLQIFSAKTSDSDPPKTVKSWLKRKTRRPSTVAVTGDDGVAVRAPLEHPEVRLAMADEPVELDERTGIAEPLGTLAREQLALLVLARHRLLRAGVQRLVAQLLEPGELLGGRRVRSRFGVVHRRESLLA